MGCQPKKTTVFYDCREIIYVDYLEKSKTIVCAHYASLLERSIPYDNAPAL